MRSWLAIILVVASCTDPNLERMTDAKAKACGCKTASCAEQVIEQIGHSPIASTPKIQKLANDMLVCLARLQDKERPVTDPDAEGSAADGSDGDSGAAATPPSPGPSAPAGSAPAKK